MGGSVTVQGGAAANLPGAATDYIAEGEIVPQDLKRWWDNQTFSSFSLLSDHGCLPKNYLTIYDANFLLKFTFEMRPLHTVNLVNFAAWIVLIAFSVPVSTIQFCTSSLEALLCAPSLHAIMFNVGLSEVETLCHKLGNTAPRVILAPRDQHCQLYFTLYLPP